LLAREYVVNVLGGNRSPEAPADDEFGTQVWIYNPSLPLPRGPGAEPDREDEDPTGRTGDESTPDVFVPATVVGRGGLESVSVKVASSVVQSGGSSRAEVEADGTLQVHASGVFLASQERRQAPDNLTDLSEANEATILHALGSRFSRGVSCTWVGDTMLVVNPLGDPIDGTKADASSKDMHLTRWNAVRRSSEVGPVLLSDVGDLATSHPTVLDSAELALDKLARDAASQSILVLGETGSGKSAVARALCDYVARFHDIAANVNLAADSALQEAEATFGKGAVSAKAFAVAMGGARRVPKEVAPVAEQVRDLARAHLDALEDLPKNLLAEKIQAVSTVLGSFLRASTADSADSSRCATQWRIFLAHPTTGSPACVSIDHPDVLARDAKPLEAVAARVDLSPLDLERVTHTPPGERSFHVFYEICAGLPTSLAARLSLPEAQYCKLLHRGGVLERNRTAADDSDVRHLSALERALSVLGLDSSTRETVYSVLAAILALGDVQFTAAGGGEVMAPPFATAKAPAAVVGTSSDAHPSLEPPPAIPSQGDASELSPAELQRLHEAHWAARRFHEACTLLGVPAAALASSLTRKTLPKPSDTSVGGTTFVPVPVAQAEVRRDRLCRALYGALVDALVARINEQLGADHPAIAVACASESAPAPSSVSSPPATRWLASPTLQMERLLSGGATGQGLSARSVLSSCSNPSLVADAASSLLWVSITDIPGYSRRPLRSEFNPPPDAAFDPEGISAGGAFGLGRNGLWHLVQNWASERLEFLFTSAKIVSKVDLLRSEGVLRSYRPAPVRSTAGPPSRRGLPGDVGPSMSKEDELYGLEQNEDVLALLDSRSIGVLDTIDEATSYARFEDEALLKKVASVHKRNQCLGRVAESVERVAAATYAEEYMTAEDAVVSMYGPAVVGAEPGASSESLVAERRARAHGMVVRQLQRLFSVKHTQGHTAYDVLGMLASNRASSAPLSVAGCLCKSSNAFVSLLGRLVRAQSLRGVCADAAIAGPCLKSASHLAGHAVSVYDPPSALEDSVVGDSALEGANCAIARDIVCKIGRFLEVAAPPLKAVDPLFVRCVVPNYLRLRGEFVSKAVGHQLRSQAVVPATRAAIDGFAFNAPFASFYDTYLLAVPRATSQRLPLACPRGASPAEARSLCEAVVKALWSEYPSVLGKLDRESQVVLGRSLVFCRKETAAALEGIRAARRASMERAATVVQSRLHGHFHRARFERARDGITHLQAAFRAKPVREAFLHSREAAILIQAQLRGFHARSQFALAKRALNRVKACWAARKARLRFQRARRTLRRLQAVAVGALIRAQLLEKYGAAVRIQRFMRRFLVKNRKFWGHVHAALLFQAAWRGHRWRQANWHLVLFVRKRVAARLVSLRVTRLQAKTRGKAIRRLFLRVRKAAVSIQRWFRALIMWRGLRVMREATLVLQRMSRHALFRMRLRGNRERRLLAEHVWHTMLAREKETSQIVHHLQRVSKINAAKHRRLRERLSESRRAEAVKDKWGFSFAGFARFADGMRESDKDHVAHEHYLTRDSLVLDVDAMTTVEHSYPAGWTKSLSDLDAALRERGQRIQMLGIGSHHTVALSSEGHVYTWGLNDRSQLGHGFVRRRVEMSHDEAKRARQAQAFRTLHLQGAAKHTSATRRRSMSVERAGRLRHGYADATSSRAAAVAMTVGVPLGDIEEEDEFGVPFAARQDLTKPMSPAANSSAAKLVRRMSSARAMRGGTSPNFEPLVLGSPRAVSPPHEFSPTGSVSKLHLAGAKVQENQRRPSLLQNSPRDGFLAKGYVGTSPPSSAHRHHAAARSPSPAGVSPVGAQLYRASSASSVASRSSTPGGGATRLRRQSKAVTTQVHPKLGVSSKSMVLGRGGSFRNWPEGHQRSRRQGDDGSSVGTDDASLVQGEDDLRLGQTRGLQKRGSRVWGVGGTSGSVTHEGRRPSFVRRGGGGASVAYYDDGEAVESGPTILDTRVITVRRNPDGITTPTMVQGLRYEPGVTRTPLHYLTEGVKIVSIAVGADHTLALTEAGRVMAWGANSRGQLGIGHRESTAEPVEVPGLLGRKVAQIAAGPRHSMAVMHSGVVYSWGAGEFTGHGMSAFLDPHERFSETSVALAATAALARGETSLSAEAGTGAPKFIPGGHKYGAWSDDSKEEESKASASTDKKKKKEYSAPDRLDPSPIRSLSRHTVKQVVCGWGFTLALTLQGRVFGWGDNANGQLGVGTPHADGADGCVEFEPLPVSVWPPPTLEADEDDLDDPLDIDGLDEKEPLSTPRHSVALDARSVRSKAETFAAEAAASGAALRLGTKAEILATTTDDASTLASPRLPGNRRERRVYFDMPISLPSKAQREKSKRMEEEMRAIEDAHERKAKKAETAKKAGVDEEEDVTNDLLNRNLPLPEGTEESDFAGPAVEIAAGGNHVVLRTRLGGVWTWGSNSFGQLGLGHFDDQYHPRLVRALTGSNVSCVAGGWRHSLAVVDGAIVAWGHTGAVPTVTPLPMPPPPPGVAAGGDGGEWAGARPRVGRLDLTHSVSPLPLESPFRTNHRSASAVVCPYSHTLSVSMIMYTELLLGHDPRKRPATAVERAQSRLQMWKSQEKQMQASGAGQSRGLAALAAAALELDAELDGGMEQGGEDSDEAASVPDELRDDAYLTGGRRHPVAGYVDSYITRVKSSLPVSASQAAAAAEAGTDIFSPTKTKSTAETRTAIERLFATAPALGPASLGLSSKSHPRAGSKGETARKAMGQRRPTLSILPPSQSSPLKLPTSPSKTVVSPARKTPPPPPPRNPAAASSGRAGALFTHNPTSALHGANRPSPIASAAAALEVPEEEPEETLTNVPGLAQQVSGPISSRWVATGLARFLDRPKGHDKALRAAEPGRASREAKALTPNGLLHAAAIAHAAAVARRAASRGMTDKQAAEEAARALRAGTQSAKRTARRAHKISAALGRSLGERGQGSSVGPASLLGVAGSPAGGGRRGSVSSIMSDAAEPFDGTGAWLLSLFAAARARELARVRHGAPAPESSAVQAMMEANVAIAGGDVGALVAAGVDPSRATEEGLVLRGRQLPTLSTQVPAGVLTQPGLILSARAVADLINKMRFRRLTDTLSASAPLERLALQPSRAYDACKLAETVEAGSHSAEDLGLTPDELGRRLSEAETIEHASLIDVAICDARVASQLRADVLRHIARHPQDVLRVAEEDGDVPEARRAALVPRPGYVPNWRESGISVGDVTHRHPFAVAMDGVHADAMSRPSRMVEIPMPKARKPVVLLQPSAIHPLHSLGRTGFGRKGYSRSGVPYDRASEAFAARSWRQREQAEASERALRLINLQREAERAERAKSKEDDHGVSSLRRYDPARFPFPASRKGLQHKAAVPAKPVDSFSPSGVRPMDAVLDESATQVVEPSDSDMAKQTAWTNRSRLATSSTAAPVGGNLVYLSPPPAPTWAGQAARAIHEAAHLDEPEHAALGFTDEDVVHEALTARREAALGAIRQAARRHWDSDQVHTTTLPNVPSVSTTDLAPAVHKHPPPMVVPASDAGSVKSTPRTAGSRISYSPDASSP
jgi:alpha-tubulin suppressor-like RCC1 family protein